MKGYLFLWIMVGIVVMCLDCEAQTSATILYGYDGAGNQIYRGINAIITNGRIADTTAAAKVSKIISKDSSYQITVLPNPAQRDIHIHVTGLAPDDKVTYALYDIRGSSSLMTGEANGQTTIDLSAQADGLYILVVWVKGDKREWKIVKER